MSIQALGTYRPAWEEHGARVAGLDEDVVTLAVAAGRALGDLDGVVRVVLVTRRPDFLDGNADRVISAALGLPASTAVEERLGGGPAVLDAVTAAPPGALVIGVSTDAFAGAAAALVGDGGAVVKVGARGDRSLPIRTRAVGLREDRIYDDPRLLRERGSRPAIARAIDGFDGQLVVTGVSAQEARRAGSSVLFDPRAGAGGAAEPLFAAAQLFEQGIQGRVVAVEGGSSIAVDIGDGAARVEKSERRETLPTGGRTLLTADIPISVAAYDRAFDAKIGLLAGRCACGELSFPPRRVCLSCGADARPSLVPLSREASVYTTTTIHVHVPGIPSPYSLAVVSLADSPVRVLVPVTDALPGTVEIGMPGRLVLRKLATREGIPDYGYAFQPHEGGAA